MHRPHRQSGVSLIECCVASAIVAAALGTALPSFDEMRQRRLLEGTAAQLETDLQLARSEAVARNEGVRLAFEHDGTRSCYVMHTGAAGACRCDVSGIPQCDGGAEAMRQVHLGPTPGIDLRSNIGSMLFDPTKGTVTPTGTLKLRASPGSVHLVVNVMGRVRSCTPDGALPGMARC